MSERTVVDVIGRGLVNEGRARRDQIRERQERYQKRLAAAQIAVPVAGALIKDNLMQKAQDFFQSEPVLGANRGQRKATRLTNQIYAVRDAMTAADKDEETFYFDSVRPVVLDNLTREAEARQQSEGVNILGRNIETGAITNQQFLGTVDRISREIAQERAETYRRALSAADQVVSSDEYDAMVLKELKDVTPTTLVGAAARKVNQFFGGKSTAELQAQAIADIKNHYFSENAAALNSFESALNQGRTLASAVDYGQAVLDMEEFNNRIIREEVGEQLINRKDGSVMSLPFKVPIMQDGSKGERIYGTVSKIPGIEGGMTPEEERAEVRAARSNYNVRAIGSSLVGDQTFQEQFINKLSEDPRFIRESDNSIIVPGAERNMDEYRLVLNEYLDFMKNNSNLIGQEERDKLFYEESLKVGIELFELDDSIQDLRFRMSKEGLGEKINDPEYQKLFNHLVNVNLGKVEIGDYASSGISSEFFLANSALATSHLDYIMARNSFANIATREGDFYNLLRQRVQ